MYILCYLKAFCSHQWAAGPMRRVAMSIFAHIDFVTFLMYSKDSYHYVTRGRTSKVKKSIWQQQKQWQVTAGYQA